MVDKVFDSLAHLFFFINFQLKCCNLWIILLIDCPLYWTITKIIYCNNFNGFVEGYTDGMSLSKYFKIKKHFMNKLNKTPTNIQQKKTLHKLRTSISHDTQHHTPILLYLFNTWEKNPFLFNNFQLHYAQRKITLP